MESILTPADPAVPPAPYLGGKRYLAARIAARLAAVPHVTYVEPFVGMGGVFFRRPFRAKAEVINDISTDVANLFRVLQRHYVPLMDLLRWQVTSRAEFERLCQAQPDTLTDLERAARFLYLQRTAFGGRVVGQSFGVSPANPGRFDVAKLGAILERVHERLSGVIIERLPFPDLLRRYDRPTTMFYLDPPYWGCEQDYGAGVFARADFERMADQLAGLAGPWLLSVGDRPEIRTTFERFTIEPIATTYGINRDRSTPAQELLISPSKGA